MLCLNMNVWRQFSIFCAYYGWPQLSSCGKVITRRFSVWPHVSLCNHLTVEEFRCFSSRPVVARWSPIGLLAYVTGTLEKHLCCTIKIHSSLNKSHSPGATFLKYSFCARISFSTWVYLSRWANFKTFAALSIPILTTIRQCEAEGLELCQDLYVLISSPGSYRGYLTWLSNPLIFSYFLFLFHQ